MKKFKYSEQTYLSMLQRIESEIKLPLTEFEAGLCRAILDIRTEIYNGGACIGSNFKKETARFIKLGLLHKDTFKYCGVCVPTGKLDLTIIETISNNLITA
jgi:hypothetical protein